MLILHASSNEEKDFLKPNAESLTRKRILSALRTKSYYVFLLYKIENAFCRKEDL